MIDVNRALEGRFATLYLARGVEVQHAHEILIGVIETSYKKGRKTVTVPTDEVERVVVTGNSGAGPGFLVGAIPGLAIVGATALGIGEVGRGEKAIGYFLGGGLAFIGGMLGGQAGYDMRPLQEVVVYRAPVEQYLR